MENHVDVRLPLSIFEKIEKSISSHHKRNETSKKALSKKKNVPFKAKKQKYFLKDFVIKNINSKDNFSPMEGSSTDTNSSDEEEYVKSTKIKKKKMSKSDIIEMFLEIISDLKEEYPDYISTYKENKTRFRNIYVDEALIFQAEHDDVDEDLMEAIIRRKMKKNAIEYNKNLFEGDLNDIIID